MTAATWSQKDILSNALCNLARLDVRNYVVAALDQKIFNWAAFRGHGVFLFPPHKENLEKIKLSSAAVLEALGLGYSVFFLDPDVVLFKNPVQHIVDFSRMLVLSNAPFIESEEQIDVFEHTSAPRNGARRINSGCYFVPATKPAISAFMVLQSHALANSDSSEEPSFFNIFCLPPWGGVNSKSTPPQGCVFVSTAGALQMKFLDFSAFAQGSVFLSQEDPAFTGVLYHNWIKDDPEKIQKQKAAGLWFLRPDLTCF